MNMGNNGDSRMRWEPAKGYVLLEGRYIDY